jgi:hypothetical protein
MKTTLENHFLRIGNREVYGIFKTCCVISVLFFIKCHAFYGFVFYSSNIILEFYKPAAV